MAGVVLDDDSFEWWAESYKLQYNKEEYLSCIYIGIELFNLNILSTNNRYVYGHDRGTDQDRDIKLFLSREYPN